MSFVVVALAVALRVAWVLAVPTKPVGDFAMYVESAAHLVEHGAFDSEYVYMPGYVFLIAPVQALGGGWLATKLVGAVLGGLGAGAVVGITRQMAGGCSRVALVAGLLYACWPAGIAMASVTGTDMPAAVLLIVAAYFLVRFAGERPILAAILFGVFTGCAAFIRAIVVPLAALSVLVFRAQGRSWRTSMKSTAIACLVAFLMLVPWAVRNRLRYGETFFTDSHGGLTALVGANPNTDGCYSRALNRMSRDVTGYTLLAEPHREANRASLAIAKTWIGFDPVFTIGLLASKAERLLVHERALLYWPLFRAGVLPPPHQAFFARHRASIEAIADAFWLCVLALALMGCALAYARKQWLALSLIPQVTTLAVLYTAIFAEPRYRLPIFVLLLPLSALAIEWLWQTGRDLMRRALSPAWKREAALAAGLTALAFAAAPALAWAGGKLREHHRWAASECQLEGKPQFCTWRTVSSEGVPERGPAIKGVWNGVGLVLPGAMTGRNAAVTVESEFLLAQGDYTLDAALDIAPFDPARGEISGSVSFSSNDQPLSPALLLADVASASREGKALAWHAPLRHAGGPLRFRVRVEVSSTLDRSSLARLWLSELRVKRGMVP
ncbi:MAG TPA: glycosyltransferase family 39 protein [Polyangia bacterium]